MTCLTCNECYWCSSNDSLSDDMVCCNQKSENYNKIFSEEESKTKNCEHAETEQAIDYFRLTPWEFASKYYM